MNFLLKIIAYIGVLVNYVYHILANLLNLENKSPKNKFAFVTGLFLLLILISKEFIIFNEEVLVVVSFFGFVYFLYVKISDMIYLELVSRNEQIYREADLNLFYHQKIIKAILDLYKVASYVQNKLKNEYIFFRHVFLLNLWPCKAMDYINNNLKNIEKNFNIIYNEQNNIYQNIQLEQNLYNYELLKNMSKLYI